MAGESLQVLSEGDEAPAFDLPGADGERYSPQDFLDYEALLLAFTCNHCPYAQAKEPLLNDLAEEYDEVAVVGINSNDPEQYPDDSPARMRERVEEGEVRYDAYLFDESQAVAKSYGAVCTPDPFLFRNDDGTFRLAYHGQLDDALNPDEEASRYHVREAIEAVLAGEEVDVEHGPSRGCTIKWREDNEPEYWDQV